MPREQIDSRPSEGDVFLLEAAAALGSRRIAEVAIAERDRRRALGDDVVVLWNRDTGKLSIGPAVGSARRSG